MIPCVRLLVVVLSLNCLAFGDRIVRDERGRDVSVPDHPHRLVCLAPSITDTVYSLGRGSDVIGITDYTLVPPEARLKPSVGGVLNPSLEKLTSLRPDLVLAIGDMSAGDVIRAVERLGFPVFVVQPTGLRAIYRSIESVGRAINASAEASALVARLQAREEAVRRRVAGKPRPSILFLLWPDPIMTAGRGAFITELIEVAGGRSVTADLPTEWPRISFEFIMAHQPEYLLFRKADVTLQDLRRQGNWNRLLAVQNGKVFYADDRLQFPSPMVFDALEDLARQFHPPAAQGSFAWQKTGKDVAQFTVRSGSFTGD